LARILYDSHEKILKKKTPQNYVIALLWTPKLV